MRALLLGAGASYECGMPLVWEFTNVLRANVLKRLDTRLFDFSKDPGFRARFEEILAAPQFHYEQMVGELESIHLARGAHSETARTVALQLVECVQMLLLEDQEKTTGLFSEKVKDYSGLKKLVADHPCLHVFSLNHDVNFEEICKYYDLPYKDGFFDVQDDRYSHIANFKTLTRGQVDSGNLSFYGQNELGINLIKLHGSIDFFAAEDKNLYLKCHPIPSTGIGGHVQEIRKVEKHGADLLGRMQIRPVNELYVLDKHGQLQFLRRSLLSGANKFKGNVEQIAPVAFFQEFKNRIKLISQLDVIGYGFGDSHINEVLLHWLRLPEASLSIYDPYRTSVPEVIAESASKIRIANCGLTGYLDEVSPDRASMFSRVRRMVLEDAREKLRKKRLAVWQ